MVLNCAMSKLVTTQVKSDSVLLVLTVYASQISEAMKIIKTLCLAENNDQNKSLNIDSLDQPCHNVLLYNPWIES